MALTQKFDLRPKIGLIWKENKPRRGKRREEEEEEEEDEGEKFKQSQIKVWKLTLSMELYESMEF